MTEQFSRNGQARVDLDRRRDIACERAVTLAAARGASAEHPERLIAFAEGRAARGSGELRNFAIRDFGLETLEELADSRNYLVWWRQQLDAVLGSEPIRQPLVAAVDRALGLVALAYEQVDQARQLAQLAPVEQPR